jgi:hypothetical protein
MTDVDLEDMMRIGLRRKAGEADVRRVPAVVDAARGEIRAGRRTVWLGGGAVAATIVLVATLAVALGGHDGRAHPRPGPAAPTSAAGDPAPAGWRTEYWHDAEVQVPDTWGWGISPHLLPGFSGHKPSLGTCGDGASVDHTGKRFVRRAPLMPYVGRPIWQSDVCSGLRPDRLPEPTAPYVWLGPAIPTGRIDFPNGYVLETRDIGGTRVSVATDDTALRHRIMSSARVSSSCAPRLDLAAAVTGAVPSTPTGLMVCAYVRTSATAAPELAFAARRNVEAVRALLSSWQVRTGPVCRPRAPRFATNWVTIALAGASGQGPVAFRVDLDACRIVGANAKQGWIDEADVAPWGGGGLRAVMSGPNAPWASRYFRARGF